MFFFQIHFHSFSPAQTKHRPFPPLAIKYWCYPLTLVPDYPHSLALNMRAIGHRLHLHVDSYTSDELVVREDTKLSGNELVTTGN